MPINPIDIFRSQEASMIKQMDTQRAQSVQGQINQSFQKMIQQDSQKPKETSKTENQEYRYDAKEKGNNRYYSDGNTRDRKENKDESKDKKKPKEPNKGNSLDILI